MASSESSTFGYSGTPLVKKLGIKSGMRVLILNAPEGYLQTPGDLPEGVIQVADLQPGLDFIQFFTLHRAELEAALPDLKAALAPDGMLWVSWVKKAAKIPTDVTEDTVRDLALTGGLVDVKVCAVDATWSGLKLVYRVKDRG